MRYEHTQKGQLHSISYAVAGLLFAAAWLTRELEVTSGILVVAGCVVALLSFCFVSLAVADEGDRLSVRFGRIPLFRKSILYSEITGVEPGRTTLGDGWGVHYVPGRGWTYNLWGFDCVILHLGQKKIRIGSDDVENLVEFLESRTKSGSELSGHAV